MLTTHFGEQKNAKNQKTASWTEGDRNNPVPRNMVVARGRPGTNIRGEGASVVRLIFVKPKHIFFSALSDGCPVNCWELLSQSSYLLEWRVGT